MIFICTYTNMQTWVSTIHVHMISKRLICNQFTLEPDNNNFSALLIYPDTQNIKFNHNLFAPRQTLVSTTHFDMPPEWSVCNHFTIRHHNYNVPALLIYPDTQNIKCDHDLFASAQMGQTLVSTAHVRMPPEWSVCNHFTLYHHNHNFPALFIYPDTQDNQFDHDLLAPTQTGQTLCYGSIEYLYVRYSNRYIN